MVFRDAGQGGTTRSKHFASPPLFGQTYLEPPRFTVTQLIAEADTIAALGEIELQTEPGHWTRYEYCDVWRVREGKLAELRAYVVEVG